MLLGILTSYVLGAFLEWRSHGAACLIVTALAVFLLPLVLETPAWLLSQGEETAALSILETLQDKEGAMVEIERLKNLQSCSPAWRPALCNSETMKGLGVGLGVMSFQQLSGVNGITFYAIRIFEEAEGGWGAHVPSILLACAQVMASVIATQVIDRGGRRLLLGISAITTCLASAALAVYFEFGVSDRRLFWVPLALLVTYFSGFAVGFGPVAWICLSEVLPETLRPVLNPLVMAFTWSLVFGVTKSFPLLLLPLELKGLFALYAGTSLAALLFVFLCVPETKGKDSNDLKRVFQTSNDETTSPRSQV
jgi:hypothetical protein